MIPFPYRGSVRKESVYSLKNTYDTLSYIERRITELQDDFGRALSASATAGISEVEQNIHSTQAGEIENQLADLNEIKKRLSKDVYTE